MDEGVFLPHLRRESSFLTRNARLNLSDAEREILLNGVERPRNQAGENSIVQKVGDQLRLCFDPDFERMSIFVNKKMRVFAMKLHTGKDFAPVHVASTLVKSFAVYGDGKLITRVDHRLRKRICLCQP